MIVNSRPNQDENNFFYSTRYTESEITKLIQKFQKTPALTIGKSNRLLGEGGLKKIYKIFHYKDLVLVELKDNKDGLIQSVFALDSEFKGKLLIGIPFIHKNDGDHKCFILMPKMKGDIWGTRQILDDKNQVIDSQLKKEKKRCSTYLKKESDQRILDLALMVCRDLEVLHKEDWVHGDLHPSNILFSLMGSRSTKAIKEIRISDFDLATYIEKNKKYIPQGRNARHVPEAKNGRIILGPEGAKKIDMYCLESVLRPLLIHIKNEEIGGAIKNLLTLLEIEEPNLRPSIEEVIETLDQLKLVASDL